MASASEFQHLNLLLVKRGTARLHGGGDQNPQTIANKQNRASHRDNIMYEACELQSYWTVVHEQRGQEGLPRLTQGIPLLLKIDDAIDIDSIRNKFNFELISEENDGYVIVASSDIELRQFKKIIDEFSQSIHGSTIAASIFEVVKEDNNTNRLDRILDESIRERWDAISSNDTLVVEITISCSGCEVPPKRPTKGVRMKEETYQRKLQEWQAQFNGVYINWDKLRLERMNDIERIFSEYNSEILDEFEDTTDCTIPDNFRIKVKLSGKALKDFAQNYPYIFEVADTEEIFSTNPNTPSMVNLYDIDNVLSPNQDSPTVCVIDSGIQENHFMISGAMKSNSFCFLPSQSITDTADYVHRGGHGTRVAGAILYGDNIPKYGTVQLETWIENARVLDQNCCMPATLLPDKLIKNIINKYHNQECPTKIFNHSINSIAPCKTKHMSAWAHEIDKLSHTKDVLFIQSIGNVRINGTANNPGVQDLLASGHTYPGYLDQPTCRASNPGQSLQALTVGSIAFTHYADPAWTSFAKQPGEVSAFSRSGPGLWGSIKPEVVEYGGDYLFDTGKPCQVGTPNVAQSCYPELLRSTLSNGPAIGRDSCGTSFATPKVARVASAIQQVLPTEPALLYRSLIINSARWPEWAESAPCKQKSIIIKRIGYGIPQLDRATTNTKYRATFITSGLTHIKARECHIYQIPIPSEIANPGSDHPIRIDITLSYSAEARRSRRGRRGYLAVCADWLTNNKNEPIDRFISRALKNDEAAPKGKNPIPWTIGDQSNRGIIPDASRSNGTLQKDWAYLRTNELPEDFCIAVRGKPGWDKSEDAYARYTLSVSIESMGDRIEIYEHIQAAISELEADLKSQVEAEVEIEL